MTQETDPILTEIIIFLSDQIGEKNIYPETDFFNELGFVGDDFHEMMEAYSEKFNVDLTDYLWYFHTDEEGFNFPGVLFFRPPYQRVERIPVTPLLLSKFAKTKKWDIDYPEHHIPEKRYDLMINTYVLYGYLFLVLVMVLFIFL